MDKKSAIAKLVKAGYILKDGKIKRSDIEKATAFLATASVEEDLDTIRHLDSYFKSCEEMGQGINSKEVIQMKNAMERVLKARMGYALDLNDELQSENGKNAIQRGMDTVYPGMREMFSTKASNKAQAGFANGEALSAIDSYIDELEIDESEFRDIKKAQEARDGLTSNLNILQSLLIEEDEESDDETDAGVAEAGKPQQIQSVGDSGIETKGVYKGYLRVGTSFQTMGGWYSGVDLVFQYKEPVEDLINTLKKFVNDLPSKSAKANVAEAMKPESYKGWKITVQKKRGTDKYAYKISGLNFSRSQNSGFTDTAEEAMKLAKKEVDTSMSKK
jgi:hypothetical protein